MLEPITAATSKGLGKNAITASNISLTPLFLNAEPHNTGKNLTSNVALRIVALSISLGTSSPSK